MNQPIPHFRFDVLDQHSDPEGVCAIAELLTECTVQSLQLAQRLGIPGIDIDGTLITQENSLNFDIIVETLSHGVGVAIYDHDNGKDTLIGYIGSYIKIRAGTTKCLYVSEPLYLKKAYNIFSHHIIRELYNILSGSACNYNVELDFSSFEKLSNDR